MKKYKRPKNFFVFPVQINAYFWKTHTRWSQIFGSECLEIVRSVIFIENFVIHKWYRASPAILCKARYCTMVLYREFENFAYSSNILGTTRINAHRAAVARWTLLLYSLRKFSHFLLPFDKTLPWDATALLVQIMSTKVCTDYHCLQYTCVHLSDALTVTHIHSPVYCH